MRVTILGAGDMGTAITAPIARNGHEINLWGTHFDDHVIAALRDGQVHPRLQYPIPAGVRPFHSVELGAALNGTDLLILAVSSGAIDAVLDTVLAELPILPPLISLAKGLTIDEHDIVHLISDRIQARSQAPVVVVGGPAKANEVVMQLPTISVFASDDAAINALAAETLRTPMYEVQITPDRIGVEIAAAMKNAYAIAVGVATGIELRSGVPHQNLKAALFSAAVSEMAVLAETLGGSAATVYGLSGTGDLTVTVSAGRNRLLGELLGRGQTVAEALGALVATGITIEGHAAVTHGYALARNVCGVGAVERFPMLHALHAILSADAPPFETLWQAIGPSRIGSEPAPGAS